MDVVEFLEKNADAWEIYFSRTVSKSVEIEKGRIKMIESSEDVKYAVRVIKDGRVGFATSSRLSTDLCERALKIAKISGERLEVFPEGKKRKVDGLYDSKVAKLETEWLIELAEVMINSAEELGDVNPSQGHVEASVEEIELLNSFGADLKESLTTCEAFLECVIENSSAFEFDQSRTSKLDVEFVGRRSAEMAIESLNACRIDKGKYDVVLSPIAVHELLSYALYPAFFAENVLKGRSPLTETGKNYLGEITIVDDATIPYGLMSFCFDDEGVEAKEKVIFDEGVLRSYISDFRHALEMNIEPTGNGLRGDDLYPTTSPSNIILEFECTEENLEENSLVVHALIGAHTSNPVSGDFSLECMNAFLIKNGERVPVKSAMIYGNVYELLRNVEAFGKDVRQIENTITPSVRFSNVFVSG